MERWDKLILDDQVTTRPVEVEDSGVSNAIIREWDSGAGGDHRAVAMSAFEEHNPLEKEAVMPGGVVGMGVDGCIAEGVDIEALEAREGQSKLALGGNEHDLWLDDEVAPGRQTTVEVSGAGLGNGDEADRFAVATVSRDILKKARPGVMVYNRREGRLRLVRGGGSEGGKGRKGGWQAARRELRGRSGIRLGLRIAASQQKVYGLKAGVGIARIPKRGQALRLVASKIDRGEIRYEADDVVPHRRERGEEGRLRQSDRRWEAKARQGKGQPSLGKSVLPTGRMLVNLKRGGERCVKERVVRAGSGQPVHIRCLEHHWGRGEAEPMVRTRRRAPAHEEEFTLEAVPKLLHITKLGDDRKRLQMRLQSRPRALRHPVRLSNKGTHALKAQSIAVLRLCMPGWTTDIREIMEEGEGKLRRIRGRSGRHVGCGILVIGRSGEGAIDIHFVGARLKAELRFAKGVEETSCIPRPLRRAEHVSVIQVGEDVHIRELLLDALKDRVER
jgi:hypothetical protein